MAEAGYCQCGCGERTPLAKWTRRGYRKGEPMRFILGHHMRTAESKALVYTERRNAKIRQAHADGRIPLPPRQSGADHQSWRGDAIGYAQAHTRVTWGRGSVSNYLCANCGANADEWAVDHDHESLQFGEHCGLTKAYSADVSAYVPLCRSCHRSADRRGGYRCHSPRL